VQSHDHRQTPFILGLNDRHVLTSLLFTFSLLDSSRDGDLFLPSTGSDIKSEFSLEPEKLEIALSDVAELKLSHYDHMEIHLLSEKYLEWV
jgi:hypothetical protein